MAIETLLARYGLWAILLGAGIEGEAVVVSGGVLAHRGLVPLGAAMVCAGLGSCVVDQLWFLAGRRFRDHRWVGRARAKPAFDRALRLLERYPTSFILAFRFVYGMRTVSPIAIGTSRVPTRTFVPLNMLAATIWACLFTWIGFRFGNVIDPLIERLKSHTHLLWPVLGGVIVLAAAAWLVRHLMTRRQTPDSLRR